MINILDMPIKLGNSSVYFVWFHCRCRLLSSSPYLYSPFRKGWRTVKCLISIQENSFISGRIQILAMFT